MKTPRVTFDFETRSTADLKKTGAYKYSVDPTTKPTCLAIKEHGAQSGFFFPYEKINLPWKKHSAPFKKWLEELIEVGAEFSAHNAFFERCIYTNILVQRYGWPEIPFDAYRCTAAKAAACALPRSLEKAGEVMELSIQKDKRGYQAMMATCKPTRAWRDWKNLQEKHASGVRLSKANLEKLNLPEPPLFLEPEDAPEVFETLYKYCRIDVETEIALDESLPDLIPQELAIWQLNQRLNWNGLRIDIPTVKKITAMLEVESKKKLKELDSLTMGLVTKPGARNSIMEFLELEGVKLPNLQAQTVEDKLNSFDLSEDMHRLLELRQALSKTSTKKYQAFLDRAVEDRVRDILLYHGASTGRDTGTGVQPHNFPKGVIEVDFNRPYAHVENIVECEPEMLEVLYGDSLAMLFSSVLRNMIIPSKGCELFVADFSKIEVAVLWWISGNAPGLRILRSGRDPYVYQAAANFGKTYEEYSKALEQKETWAIDGRQLGKAQVLGCGFGMGKNGKRFKAAAWEMYRIKLSKDQSISAVCKYREANPAVPEFWKACEKSAVTAVETGSVVKSHHCEFRRGRGFLWIKLPSGRKIAYRKPQVVWRETEYGPRKTLEFWAVNPKTKKWDLERTWGGVLAQNIVQSTARDLMMPAMLRLEKAGYTPLLMVHDEGICEKRVGRGSIKEFIEILCRVPSWGRGLPVSAEGWVGPRYRK